MVGYTALMGSDEGKAFEVLQIHSKIIELSIKKSISKSK
jgi:hypothetical protein